MPTTTNYIWDEDNLLAEADGTNAINTVYTNEPQQQGNLVSTRTGGTTSYHHFDGLGSTRQLTNAVGHVTDSMNYDAWGNVVARTGTTNIVFVWIGEIEYYYDLETGMFSVRERPYGPEIARWTAAERQLAILVRFAPYVYALNSPAFDTDPAGRDPIEPRPEPPAPPAWVPGFQPGSCTEEMQACITAAFNRAMQMLLDPATVDCFSAMLTSLGSSCKSGQLVNCLIAVLESTTYKCAGCGAGAATLPSPCTTAKRNETADCKKTNCTADCKPCDQPKANVNICHFGSADFVGKYCSGEHLVDPDRIVTIIIHEASHGCVGPHTREGDPQVIDKGVGHDYCARPDAYSIQTQFAACHALKPGYLPPGLR